MRLSERLQTIADQVNPGESVADIGTDHGFLPIYLTQTQKSPKVVLSDISGESLKKALTDCKEYMPSKEFDLREGNGLKVLKPGEVDTVVIAGMGGILISEIIKSDLEHARTFARYILQPRNNIAKLRFSLNEIGFIIEKEIPVREGKYIPLVLTVASSGTDESAAKRPLREDVRWEYPDTLLRDRNKYTFEYLKREWSKHCAIKEKIEMNSVSGAEVGNAGKIRELEKKILRLEFLMNGLKETED